MPSQAQRVYDMLAARYPLVVARTDLLNVVPSNARVTRMYRHLYVLISQVRANLPEDEWIESIPGVGYKLRRRS